MPPNPRAIETIANAAVKGAENVAERLFADSGAFARQGIKPEMVLGSKTLAKADLLPASGQPGYGALRSHIRASLLGKGENAVAAPSDAAQRQLARALRTNAAENRLKDVKVGSGHSAARVQVFAKESEKAKQVAWLDEIDRDIYGKPFFVEKSSGRSLKDMVNPATAYSDPLLERAARSGKEKIASPSIIQAPKEAQMPTKAFELPGEKKIVSKLADDTVKTEYPGAPLPFRFSARRGDGVGSYGQFVSEVRQLPDKSVTLANPEGIDLIGRAFESAVNTKGLLTPKLEFGSMRGWFQSQFPQLKESGVPAWFRGDSSWLYGQVNAAKLTRPVEANFDHAGMLRQIKYDRPVKVLSGPFEGLTGNALGLAKNGDAVLVNTSKMVGAKPETFVYKAGGADIQSWREIASGGQIEIKRVLLLPRAFLNRSGA